MDSCLWFLTFGFGLTALIVAMKASGRLTEITNKLQALQTEVDVMRRELHKRPRAEESKPEPEPLKEPAPEPVPEPVPEVIPVPVVVAAAVVIEELKPPAPPPAEAGATSPPPPPSRPFDWESLVGVKLFSWIAGVALVLAAVFFLKYSVEHGWLSPMVRATLGIVTGVGLLVVCEFRFARGYTFTVNALDGAGIAILYATLFAIHGLWHLLPAGVVFALMLIVTAVAVALSLRHDSIFIAILGMMGGFATPALLSTGENRPIGLFSYLLLLNAGLAWVAYRKRWPVLTFGSLVFTMLYQWAWIGKFLTVSQVPLAAGIFLVFAIVGTSALWLRGTTRSEDGSQANFDRIAMAAGILPLAFAIFGAAIPAYGSRYNTLFGFLILVAAGLAILAMTRGPQWLHALGGVATLLTFAIWSGASYRSAAWPGILAWVAAFVVLFLGSGIRIRSDITLVASLLFFIFPVLAYREPATAAPALLFTVLFALLAIVAAYAIRFERGLLYFVAAFFAIVTEAVWSAKHLEPERLNSALLIYGAFALLFLIVPALARRFDRPLQPANGVGITVIFSLFVLLFLTKDAIALAAMWGLALLLAILLMGTFFEARATTRPLLSAIAVVLAWITLASWWEAAPLILTLIPALFIVALIGVIVLLGTVWAARAGAEQEFGSTAHLALAGHAFLLFVAARPELSIPPWPLFAVLLILYMANAVAALYLRRGTLVTGAAIASQVVLMIWAGGARVLPWPNVALAATLIIVACSLLWWRFAVALNVERNETFGYGAVAAVVLGHIVAATAGLASSDRLFSTLLATHAALLATLLVIAWMKEWHALAILGVPLAAIATGAARTNTPEREFIFAFTLYAPFIAYPLLLGRRAKQSFYPYLAAVLASVPFFFFARDAMIDAGYKSIIGILPVAQALVMMALLYRLLKIEEPSQRTLNRLALVAGSALAFITLAVPLQLEKQWITIGWALEGAALVWLYTRIRHRGLVAWGAALVAAAFVRLALNPQVFTYQPVSARPIFNWYLYTYLVTACAMFVAAYFWPREIKNGVAALTSAGTVLLFYLLNIEIADFYSRGRSLAFNFLSATLAQDLTYTIGWALFAIGMLIAGIAMNARAARIAALILLVVTILKCFLHDLGRLGGLYRVGSLLGLAMSLVIVGVLLQKFVMTKRAQPAEGTP